MSRSGRSGRSGVETLRSVVRAIAWIDESSLEGFSASEILKIYEANRASKHGVPVDEWTDSQRSHAAHLGALGAPKFTEASGRTTPVEHAWCAVCAERALG